MSTAEQRRLGLPWSEALWKRSRLAAGGTLLAARVALGEGIAGNLAGGTHHAFPDHAEDSADVLTFSMHGERNYPLAKMRSTVRIGLADGTDDDAYLDALDRHLPRVLDGSELDGPGPHARRRRPDIAFYLAGVDIAAGDRYGKLAVTEDGIRRRDRRVIDAVRARGIPLAIVLGGGYAASPARTAELHAHVFREALTPPPSAPSIC